MLLRWSRNTCAKSLHVLIISVVDRAYCIHDCHAVDSYHFLLWEVSFIPVKHFLVKYEACVISDASISWPFSLLEAILVDVSMAGACMLNCSLLTKSSISGSNWLCHKPTRLLHLTQIETEVLHQIHRCQCIPSDRAVVDFLR